MLRLIGESPKPPLNLSVCMAAPLPIITKVGEAAAPSDAFSGLASMQGFSPAPVAFAPYAAAQQTEAVPEWNAPNTQSAPEQPTCM